MARTPDARLILHKKSCTRPEVAAAVKEALKADIDLDVRIPWNRKDLRRLVREAVKAGVPRLVAGGGDGTLNAVVNAMMRKSGPRATALGVLPLGTANDFARGTEIPTDDVDAALNLACTGAPAAIDLGRVNGRWFANVASGGFGAKVTASTPQPLKQAVGGAAYALMGLVRAPDLKPTGARVTLPDGTVETGEIVVLSVGNNRFAGGGFEVAPRAELADGLLDVSGLASLSLAGLGELLRELADTFQGENRHFFYRQLPRFELETETPFHLNLDGEPLVGRRFAFEAVPRCLDVVLG